MQSTANLDIQTEEQIKAEVERVSASIRQAFEQIGRDREEGQRLITAIRTTGEHTDATLRETRDVLAQIRAAR